MGERGQPWRALSAATITHLALRLQGQTLRRIERPERVRALAREGKAVRVVAPQLRAAGSVTSMRSPRRRTLTDERCDTEKTVVPMAAAWLYSFSSSSRLMFDVHSSSTAKRGRW